MKNLYILCIIILLTQCSLHKTKELSIRVQVNEIDSVSKKNYSHNNCNFYSADIELSNYTDTTISFWTMTCSWSDNWISTSDSLYIFGEECPKNFPDVYIISPNKKIVYHTIVCLKESVKRINEQNVKFGFILINRFEIPDLRLFDQTLYRKIQAKKDIIWSNSIRIPE